MRTRPSGPWRLVNPGAPMMACGFCVPALPNVPEATEYPAIMQTFNYS